MVDEITAEVCVLDVNGFCAVNTSWLRLVDISDETDDDDDNDDDGWWLEVDEKSLCFEPSRDGLPAIVPAFPLTEDDAFGKTYGWNSG